MTSVRTFADFEARRLLRPFFARDARIVARELIGSHLVHAREDGSVYVARVVETEAYCGPTDAACHARFGLTKRTATLLGPPGHAYVFLIYGMYDCFNAVAGSLGAGHAVLLRACEPTFGFEPKSKLDGPGKLTRAMGLTRVHDATDLESTHLFFAERSDAPKIVRSARVGVEYAGADADKPWRFFDAKSAHVSKPSASKIGRGAPLQPKRQTGGMKSSRVKIATTG